MALAGDKYRCPFEETEEKKTANYLYWREPVMLYKMLRGFNVE